MGPAPSFAGWVRLGAASQRAPGLVDATLRLVGSDASTGPTCRLVPRSLTAPREGQADADLDPADVVAAMRTFRNEAVGGLAPR